MKIIDKIKSHFKKTGEYDEKIIMEMMENALGHKGMYYWYYDIVNDISIQSKASQRDFNIPEVVENYSGKYETIIPVHKDSMKDYTNQLKQVLEGKEECNCEIKLKDDKKDRWLNINYKVICDNAGKPVKAYGLAVDITDNKVIEMRYHNAMAKRIVSEKEIKISEKIIYSTIASEYDYVAYVNGINEEYTIFINENNSVDNISAVSGKQYEQAKIYLINKYVIEEERERLINQTKLSYIYKQLEDSRELFIFFSSVIKGEIRRKKVRFSYMNREKKQLIVSEIDVSDIYNEEQKKNEILKNALLNAESANKAKLNFLSNMSHDLRTPMNAIVGMTELSMENIDNKEKVLEYLSVIKTSSNHLLSLINDVLTMSKIENGKMVLIKEKVHIPTQVENIRQISEDMFKRKNQKFNVCINIVHNDILTDSLRINRVIINLLNNASKFTPNGGKVELRIIEIPAENNKYANIRIIVSDNGVGITKDKLPEVFKPFYTDNIITNSKNDGVGLGLTIAKSVVESSGGMIKIDSKPMEGTKITIDMHFQIDASASEYKKKEKDIGIMNNKDYNLSNMTILLAEDNYVNQMVEKALIERYGAKVVIADNGYMAYDMFVHSEENTYDMILMDIQMPIMNGYEATKAIRDSKHINAKTIPIIAMSANVFPEDVEEAMDSGMNRYIEKPINIQKLMETIEEYLIK